MELIIAAVVSLGLVVSWLILPASAMTTHNEREEVATLTSVQPQA